MWPELVAIWSMKLIGACILGLVAVWMLWQLTIHVANLFGVWGRYIVWWRYRKQCTCEASDSKKWGWVSWKPRWRFRLTERGKGIF